MKVKILRIQKSLTQLDLREKSKVGLNTIVKVERGDIDNCKIATLKKIAKALDTTVKELFFSDEE